MRAEFPGYPLLDLTAAKMPCFILCGINLMMTGKFIGGTAIGWNIYNGDFSNI